MTDLIVDVIKLVRYIVLLSRGVEIAPRLSLGLYVMEPIFGLVMQKSVTGHFIFCLCRYI